MKLEVIRRLKHVVIAAGFSASGITSAFDLNSLNWRNSQYALLEATHLIEMKQDNGHSKRLDPLQQSGFESAGGAWVSFNPWYTSAWKDTHVTLMTQLSSQFGVIWGAGTGERGVKYAISPSLRLGAIFQTELQKNTFLSLKATTLFGGQLKEKSCTANYGDLGGVQEVNCRLAASTLSPANTLPYLFNEQSGNKNQVLLQFSRRF